MAEHNSWLPKNIESFGDFLGVYFAIQISVIIVSIIFSLIIGRAGYFVSLILHYIWIITYRDYGFFIVLLLFGLFSIISHLIITLFISVFFNRNSNNEK